MSSYLPATTRSQELSRSDRRALDRMSAGTSMEVTRIRASEEIEAAKVQAIGAVATIALMETSNLSAAEAVLAQRTPHAVGRLQFIADSASAGMAQVVMQMNRRLS